jgi:aspartyl protease family protein
MRFVLPLLVLIVGSAAAAQSVSLNGQLGSQQALLVIDGQPRAVTVGATTHGVRLLSLSAGQAEVEVAGTRRTLVLGANPTRLSGAEPPRGGSQAIVLTSGPDGHFVTPGRINNNAVTFMVDTGATLVSIGQADAERLGLNLKNATRGFANTANGRVPVLGVTLASVRVGDVEVANVEAVVMPTQMPNVLLGNSFLTRFQMKRENDTMRLEKRPL